MIKVENLTKYYGPNLVLKDISFNVEKGEILGFLGPNGAGKTTTMRILTCFMPPSGGRVTVGGYDVFNNPLEVKKIIGYLPERPPLYLDMSVTDFLKFVARIKGVEKKSILPNLERVLNECGLEEVKNRLIGRLSKGYQQRVGLAHALIHDPQILILDEPTVGLDPKQIIEIRELIKKLGNSHTIILSSHILPEVTMTCNRIIIINEGRIAAVDSYTALSAKLRQSEKVLVKVARGDKEMLVNRLGGIPGITQVLAENTPDTYILESPLGTDLREEISRKIIENGWGLLEIRSISLTLEDIFLKLTTEEKLDQPETEILAEAKIA